ncbi:GNAT family N-acetyltransferase [Amorphoplanes digitatis]|uniref:RimJ/RimL family protein N-acetyltransferase n=1 Tax=Actinoplanes digitatis TaxID=1868 RepID=A0A7W7HWY4_9ACTN|nr:GNAT family N-acetyltransferase [Actinoplanes digitatis]MBB4762254.1 RimJ/RimL family protein N-acetyltransferase [Actinoplanes digitatis]BFE71044.1 GNAT family N-acetyltransferase [Actinoplanes digitatis]GID92624.1 acetyltransferase [Actinoplanes digitatis]
MPLLISPVVAAGDLARLDQPVLTGPGLTLRPWRATDAAVVAAAYDEPGIRQWHSRSMTVDEARAWIGAWPQRWRRETGAGWAVAADDDAVLGQISLRTIDLAEGIAEISYWVLPEARGRGHAAAALSVLSGWALRVLGLHRVEVYHSTRNPASCRVAERAGYPYEGTMRSKVLHADGWHDMHLHARIAGDPAA